MVNGKVYSWEDITINVQGLEDIAITEISYDFEQEAELIYRRGGSPCGYGTGNKKNTVKLVMGREDYNKVLSWCKKKGKKLWVPWEPRSCCSRRRGRGCLIIWMNSRLARLTS